MWPWLTSLEGEESFCSTRSAGPLQAAASDTETHTGPGRFSGSLLGGEEERADPPRRAWVSSGLGAGEGRPGYAGQNAGLRARRPPSSDRRPRSPSRGAVSGGFGPARHAAPRQGRLIPKDAKLDRGRVGRARGT